MDVEKSGVMVQPVEVRGQRTGTGCCKYQPRDGIAKHFHLPTLISPVIDMMTITNHK